MASSANAEATQETESYLYVRGGRLIVQRASKHVTFEPTRLTSGVSNKSIKTFSFDPDSRIQVYRYPEGKTIRFVNCGILRATEKEDGKRMHEEDKEYHAFFIETEEFKHKEWTTEDQQTVYPSSTSKKSEGEYNVEAWGYFKYLLVGALGVNPVYDMFKNCKNKEDPDVVVRTRKAP